MIMYPVLAAMTSAALSAGASIGITVWKQKKLEESIKKLSETVTVNVEDEYIKKLVKEAVDRDTAVRIDTAAQVAVGAIRMDMQKKIQKEIDKAYSDLKSSVKEEMERQVGKVNLDAIRKEIIAEGREEAKKQFKSDLDKIVELQNDNLKNINDIYSNIADTLKGGNGTTLTIK